MAFPRLLFYLGFCICATSFVVNTNKASCYRRYFNIFSLKPSSSERERSISLLRKSVHEFATFFGVALSINSISAVAAAQQPSPQITQKVYFDIKIANYTEESIGRNRGATGSGRIVIGLYGVAAPKSVKRFLDTIDGDGEHTPNYKNAQFSKITDNILEVEKVRGVNKMVLAGTEQYEYEGNVLSSYEPILETNSISHNRGGLLTRRQLTAGPEFGITVGNATDLDGFHVVFGTVLSGVEVLDAVAALDRYTYEAKSGYAGREKDLGSRLFSNQKEFYVNMAKSMGDERAVDQRGKLLRRVLIKASGRLS